jgi:hypothetical protein
MTDGSSNYLTYELYSDAGRTTVAVSRATRTCPPAVTTTRSWRP